jgi:hypothetical protein
MTAISSLSRTQDARPEVTAPASNTHSYSLYLTDHLAHFQTTKIPSHRRHNIFSSVLIQSADVLRVTQVRSELVIEPVPKHRTMIKYKDSGMFIWIRP